MALKTVASLGSKKYERVGSAKLLRKILPGVSNYAIRTKLRDQAKKIGTGRVSLKDFTQSIGKTHGSAAASRFIEAIIKNQKKDLAAKSGSVKTEKPPVKKYLRALDNKVIAEPGGHGGPKIGVLGDTMKRSVGVAKTGATVSVGASAAHDSGSKKLNGMESLGIKKNAVGFAENFKPGKSPSGSAPEEPAKPLGGIKPII